MSGGVEVVRAEDFDLTGVYQVLVYGEWVGRIDRHPGWSGRSASFTPRGVTGVQLGMPCHTRKDALLIVLDAWQRRTGGQL